MTIGQTLPDLVYSPEFTRDPYAIFARLREQAPVCRVTTHRGMSAWMVTRHADVRALLADNRLAKDGNRIGELIPAQHAHGCGHRVPARTDDQHGQQ